MRECPASTMAVDKILAVQCDVDSTMSMRGTITSRTRVSPKSADAGHDQVLFVEGAVATAAEQSDLLGRGITSSAKQARERGGCPPQESRGRDGKRPQHEHGGHDDGTHHTQERLGASSASARAAKAGSRMDAAANTPEPTGPAACTSSSAEITTSSTDTARAMPSATPV